MDPAKDAPNPDAPVTTLKGVGPAVAACLETRGVRTVMDLLLFVPLRYLDNSKVRHVGDLKEGERAVVSGRVQSAGSLFFRSSRRRGYQIVVNDGTGLLACVWFRYTLPYMQTLGRRGQLLLVSGEVRRYRGALQVAHPEVIILDSEDEAGERLGVLPLYPEVEGLGQGQVRRIVRGALESHGSCLKSLVPQALEERHGLQDLGTSLRRVHFPEEPLAGDGRSPYLERLILEEFFLFQSALTMKRGEIRGRQGTALKGGGVVERGLLARLPFALTPAQTRVLGEISADMEAPTPMNRLLHGDVGSGKTVIAVLAACRAVDNGMQVAFMAPTEVLAEQHYLTVHRLLEQAGVPVMLLKGGAGAGRKSLLAKVREGDVRVVVGTHALIQQDVTFKRLGLAVIDEQHRFGVTQRMMLQEKGTAPDVLVMSATPIPRTLSLVVHGDLDVSVIDEMPPGRMPIRTKMYGDKARERAYAMVAHEVERGRQAYVVYPLVDESPSSELRNARKAAEMLQEGVFQRYRVGLLHGRMTAEEKERAMMAFKDGTVDVLVCTTVIEVGVDVPNASIIVIEHAERFGLSQLHQLRGRVGRGSDEAKCVLVTSESMTEMAVRRLRIIERTQDGFAIAEEDMKMRGPGEMLGARQTGVPSFRLGDLVEDGDLMVRARYLADEARDRMSVRERLAIRRVVEQRWGAEMGLFPVG